MREEAESNGREPLKEGEGRSEGNDEGRGRAWEGWMGRKGVGRGREEEGQRDGY